MVLVGLGGAVLTSRDGGKSFEVRTEPSRSGLAAVSEGVGGGILLFGEDGVVARADPASGPAGPEGR